MTRKEKFNTKEYPEQHRHGFEGLNACRRYRELRRIR